LQESRQYLKRAGLDIQVVSAAGTLTVNYATSIRAITEIQTGTYLLMDSYFTEKQSGDFQAALTVLGTVISRPMWSGAEDLAIIDVGRKSMATYYGLPAVKTPTGATCFNMPQEHGRLRLTGEALNLQIGDTVELWVRDANGTINMHDRFYALRNDLVEAVWDIPRT
jgi:D-serine deaminase-like pyridoxal phosphate-dependent protein